MQNATSSIMAGAFFDQLMRDESIKVGGTLSFCPSVFQGSMFNPLQTMMLLAWNPETESDFGADKMAEAVGVPADWFMTENLAAPPDEVITALGKSALIFLSSMRTWALEQEFSVESQEDILRAPETFSEVLAMNAQLKAAGTLPAPRYDLSA